MDKASMNLLQRNFFEDFPSELIHHLVGCLNLQSIDDPKARRFSFVCSAFRRAIINTPRLYELIIINLDGANTDGMSQWLQLKVERSRPSRDLRVYLIGRSESTSGGAILDVVMGCCERWGTLDLDIHPETLENLLHPVDGRLKSLRKLRLSFLMHAPEVLRGPFVIPPFLRDLPLLEDISILPFPARNLSLLPLRQIAHCKVALSPNAGEVEQALSALLHPESRLETLVIQMHPGGTNNWNGGGPFYAPHLLDLEMISDPYGDSDQQSGDYTKLLDSLTTPSLKSLSAWSDNISSTTFLRLGERSKWAPESLKIYWNSPFNDIVSLFSISSSLTQLILRIDDLGRLREFPQFKDPTFLPNLKGWRLVALWDRYDDGRPMAQHLTNPIGEAGSLSFLDDIGGAKFEPHNSPTTSSGQSGLPLPPLLSFEIDLLHQFVAKGTAQLMARLPMDDLNLDMDVLHILKETSATFDWRPKIRTLWNGEDAERVSAEISSLYETFQKVNSAQYLYVGLSICQDILR